MRPYGLELVSVSKSYGEREVVSSLTLALPKGALLTLLGPSGCGKTTVLRMIDGLIAPDSGTVSVLGSAPRPGPDMGFVFQSFRLIPWLTVRGNIEFALRSLKLTGQQRHARAIEVIDLVGLGRFAEAYPRQLSGGMRQRVALARAFSTRPKILLMDEPFASIDAQTRELMQMELMRIWADSESVVVFVTHSVDEAILLSDRIVLMGPRPGRVVGQFDVDLPRPRWSYDARADQRFVDLRSALSQRMYELVINDPASEFFGRDLR